MMQSAVHDFGAGRVGERARWSRAHVGVDDRELFEEEHRGGRSRSQETVSRQQHSPSEVTVSWQRAHAELVKLAARRAGLDFEEGRWLSCAYRGGAHARLGYGSFVEYAERLFGYSPRLTQEKLRVAEALEALPITAWALQIGQVSFSAARELTRVATPETEREWLEAAQGKTVREVERMVSGHRPGNRPNDLPDSGAKRHVLRFEVSGEVLATFREAMAKIGAKRVMCARAICARAICARDEWGRSMTTR